jgi:hypothetical protein
MRFLTHIFLRTEFDAYYGPINSLVEILSNKIQNEADSDGSVKLEMTHSINNCLFDIIAITAFGEFASRV